MKVGVYLSIEKMTCPQKKIKCLQWFYFLASKANDLKEVFEVFIFLSPKLFSAVSK